MLILVYLPAVMLCGYAALVLLSFVVISWNSLLLRFVTTVHLIVNDPRLGQTYWTRETFERKWQVFDRSGVVVY